MRLGQIKPKLKVHGVDGNGETAWSQKPLAGTFRRFDSRPVQA